MRRFKYHRNPFYEVLFNVSETLKEETLEVSGTIRLLSEECSNDLLNPDTEAYRKKAQKYSAMVRFVLIFTDRV